MKKLFFISAISMLGIFFTNQASIATIADDIHYIINEAKIRCHYYKPYVISGSLIGTSMVFNDKPFLCTSLLATAGAYAVYAWQKGAYDIDSLKKKYSAQAKIVDYWHESKDGISTTLFCRWRQDDYYADGMYWPTAWWMSAHKDLVKKSLLQDIYSGKITIIEQGKVIDIPTPEQVIKVILGELKQLEQDKQYLKRYTNIYRHVNEPEDLTVIHPFGVFYGLIIIAHPGYM